MVVMLGLARGLRLVARVGPHLRRLTVVAAGDGPRPPAAAGVPRETSTTGGLEADWEFHETPFDDASAESVAFAGDEAVRGLEPAMVAQAIEALLPFVSEERRTLFDSVLAQRTKRCVLAYERPSNPSNVWACLRTVDAFGVQSVHVVADREQDAKDRAAERGMDKTPQRFAERNRLMTQAMGAQKWLTLREHEDGVALCDRLRAEGYVVCVTDLSPGAVALSDVEWTARPHAVVFGNEENGISPQLRAAADLRVYMPMRGFAESLNLSVSTGVVLAHLAARGALVPDLSQADRDALRLRWMILSVKASVPILKRAGVDLPKDVLKKRQHIAGFVTR